MSHRPFAGSCVWHVRHVPKARSSSRRAPSACPPRRGPPRKSAGRRPRSRSGHGGSRRTRRRSTPPPASPAYRPRRRTEPGGPHRGEVQTACDLPQPRLVLHRHPEVLESFVERRERRTSGGSRLLVGPAVVVERVALLSGSVRTDVAQRVLRSAGEPRGDVETLVQDVERRVLPALERPAHAVVVRRPRLAPPGPDDGVVSHGERDLDGLWSVTTVGCDPPPRVCGVVEDLRRDRGAAELGQLHQDDAVLEGNDHENLRVVPVRSCAPIHVERGASRSSRPAPRRRALSVRRPPHPEGPPRTAPRSCSSRTRAPAHRTGTSPC
ncbi:hypothetical protein SAMN04487781_0344 [Cellulosimicrobium cellulans]|nr:hypothetical protein SAMN04487781_0344 [Cellulosimicrobium cellulans]